MRDVMYVHTYLSYLSRFNIATRQMYSVGTFSPDMMCDGLFIRLNLSDTFKALNKK